MASLLGGLALAPTVLITARVLQGASAALMTPQVLSIIQTSFEGDRRARAIGAYSMILAVGGAAGQIVGGLLVTPHLLAAAWRPALLLNAPIGAALLMAWRRGLPPMPPTGGRLDLGGVVLLPIALLAFILPLTLGREYQWPMWVWPSVAAGAFGGWALVGPGVRRPSPSGMRSHRAHAPRRSRRDSLGPSDHGLRCGFLLSLTRHLQGSLGFSAFHAGLIFAIYASGFAVASLSWTRAGSRRRARLPVLGPLAMAAALLGLGLIDSGSEWRTGATAPLVFAAGSGPALGFSPLANQLTVAIRPAQSASLSGLILTASLIGQAAGVAAFVGPYPSAGSHALAITTAAIAAVLVLDAACPRGALTQAVARSPWRPPRPGGSRARAGCS